MKKLIAKTLVVLLMSGCAILRDPVIHKRKPIDQYKYVVIPNTSSKISSVGVVSGGQYGVYGTTTSKEVNPREVIEGILLKKGFIPIDEIRPEILDQTLIVRYGESGKRYVAGGLGGYTLEVTITLYSAESNTTVYSCTAEGQGSTEADDIREAITRCLSGL